jgi:hypothetical protein
MQDKLAAVALLMRKVTWYESRMQYQGSIFHRKALSLRAVALTILRGVHGYTLHGQMEFDYGS